MTAVKVLERLVLPASLGLRFRDVATGLPVMAGLEVTVTSIRNPARTASLAVNSKGVWYARRFPGLSYAALAGTPTGRRCDSPAASSCAIRPSASCRSSRSTCRCAASSTGPMGSCRRGRWLLADADGASPPVVSRDAPPLFSSPGRTRRRRSRRYAASSSVTWRASGLGAARRLARRPRPRIGQADPGPGGSVLRLS